MTPSSTPPLLSEFGSCLFPVETVYATMEVKSVLTPARLRASMDAIMQMRRVGSQKRYILPSVTEEPGKRPRVGMHRATVTIPPRNYILAFRQEGLGPSYRHFC